VSDIGSALVADATLAVKSDVDRYVEQQQADELARVEHHCAILIEFYKRHEFFGLIWRHQNDHIE